MERIFCNYHPTKPALWYCSSCDAYFCSDCIAKRNIGGYNKKSIMHLCPKCSSLAEQLAAQNLAEPFWNRLPKFFTYPFQPSVIIFMAVLAAFMTLFSAPGILSIIFQILLFGVLLKYCFAVLKETAKGNMVPPEINERTITEDFNIITKYWRLGFMFFLIGAACFVFAMKLGMSISPAAGLIIFFASLIFLLLIFPASIIVLAANESLLDAINPMITVRVASRIGPSYFLMYFFLTILYAAPGVVGYFAQPYIPRIAFTFLFSLANCYYSIVAHHLMGYVILEHHEDIGYEVDVDDENAGRISGHQHVHEASSDLLNRVNILIKDGKHADAINLIQTETGGEITNLELAERYYNLLKIGQKIPEMLDHAKDYLALLVKAQKKEAYRTVYLECAAADPKFNPQAAVLFKTASSLSEIGNYQAALAAYNRFIQASPNDPLVPKAYLMAATVFYEKLLTPDKAVKILKHLIKLFPDHEIAPYAQKYLRQIEQHT